MNNISLAFFYILRFWVVLFLMLKTYSCCAALDSLPVPRFVTTKFNEVNARIGPDQDYPIDWVFTSAKEPVEIIAQYGNWRKISDITGEGGWVHSRVLSGKRAVIINSSDLLNLYSSSNKNSQIIAHLEHNLRCDLIKCKTKWCKISCKNHTGWVERKKIWGIYEHE
ncbi:MAG TPA: SH3 domain-containing protein [Candidatus Megaira endosymbiont of Nemacystus decipiens]|nr:SH3 domain-containing protein [Candidatus Megaera endosymbiont of Nemacystus decipiens]